MTKCSIRAKLDRIAYVDDMIIFTVIDASCSGDSINNTFLTTKNLGSNTSYRYLNKIGDVIEFEQTEFGEIKGFKNITLAETVK